MPALRQARGAEWAALVDTILEQGLEHLDRLGFELLMVRISGCVNCQADSFRAMHGCTQCATQAARRYRGSDGELLEQFRAARAEVAQYLDQANHSPFA